MKLLLPLFLLLVCIVTCNCVKQLSSHKLQEFLKSVREKRLRRNYVIKCCGAEKCRTPSKEISSKIQAEIEAAYEDAGDSEVSIIPDFEDDNDGNNEDHNNKDAIGSNEDARNNDADSNTSSEVNKESSSVVNCKNICPKTCSCYGKENHLLAHGKLKFGKYLGNLTMICGTRTDNDFTQDSKGQENTCCYTCITMPKPKYNCKTGYEEVTVTEKNELPRASFNLGEQSGDCRKVAGKKFYFKITDVKCSANSKYTSSGVETACKELKKLKSCGFVSFVSYMQPQREVESCYVEKPYGCNKGLQPQCQLRKEKMTTLNQEATTEMVVTTQKIPTRSTTIPTSTQITTEITSKSTTFAPITSTQMFTTQHSTSTILFTTQATTTPHITTTLTSTVQTTAIATITIFKPNTTQAITTTNSQTTTVLATTSENPTTTKLMTTLMVTSTTTVITTTSEPTAITPTPTTTVLTTSSENLTTLTTTLQTTTIMVTTTTTSDHISTTPIVTVLTSSSENPTTEVLSTTFTVTSTKDTTTFDPIVTTLEVSTVQPIVTTLEVSTVQPIVTTPEVSTVEPIATTPEESTVVTIGG